MSVNGEQPMALNCGGPAFVLKPEQLGQDLGPRLAALVKQIDTNLAPN